MTVTAILFDFFGVISVLAHELFFETAIPNYHQRQQEFAELERQYELGRITTEQYLNTISKETSLSVAECLRHLRGERVINAPLVDYIRTLKPRYKIGLISNAGSNLRDFMDPTVLAIFDDIVVSAEVGLIKPDPEIFMLACQRLGVQPSQALVVDDQIDNCDGARQAGLQTVLYRSSPQLLAEFAKILK